MIVNCNRSYFLRVEQKNWNQCYWILTCSRPSINHHYLTREGLSAFNKIFKSWCLRTPVKMLKIIQQILSMVFVFYQLPLRVENTFKLKSHSSETGLLRLLFAFVVSIWLEVVMYSDCFCRGNLEFVPKEYPSAHS